MSVFDLLIEGFGSAWLPCSLVLLLPGAASVLAAEEEAIPSTAGFMVAATGVAWLRFADIGANWPLGVAALALITAVVAYLVPLAPLGAGRRMAASGAGVLVGGAAALLWEPCVGPQFGRLLNDLPQQGPLGLAELVVFMVGVLAPVVGFLAITRLTLPSGSWRASRAPWPSSAPPSSPWRR